MANSNSLRWFTRDFRNVPEGEMGKMGAVEPAPCQCGRLTPSLYTFVIKSHCTPNKSVHLQGRNILKIETNFEPKKTNKQ